MTQADLARLWRKLTDNQRIYLINATVPREQRVRHSQTIMAGKALDRRGLMTYEFGSWTLKPEARELIAWAIERGYANYINGAWEFTAPDPPRQAKIEMAELSKLAGDGHHGAEIARKLGVTREAVRLAANRAGISLPTKGPTTAATVRFTAEELARVRQAAAESQLSVADYLRRLALTEAAS